MGSKAFALALLARSAVACDLGGLTAAEPWAKQVAFTHPYHVDTVGVGYPPEQARQREKAKKLAWLGVALLSALLISIGIVRDGCHDMRQVIADLMDETPTAAC